MTKHLHRCWQLFKSFFILDASVHTWRNFTYSVYRQSVRLSGLLLLVAQLAHAQVPVWQGAYSANPIPNPASGNASCIITASALNASGDLIVTGNLANTVNFPTATGSIQILADEFSNMFVGKWSTSSKAWVWVTNSASARANSIALSGNDIYVTGNFGAGSTTIAGTTLTTVNAENDTDGFVAKYTDNGATFGNGWAIKFGGATVPSTDEGLGVAVSGNNLYLTGKFYGTATIAGTSLTSAGQNDMFLAKYDLSTSPATGRWAVGGGSTRGDMGSDVAVNGNNVYVGGVFANSLTLSGTTMTTSSTTDQDLFLAKFIDNGTTVSNGWALSDGGTGGNDVLNRLKVVGSDVFFTGFYYGGGANIAGVNLSSSNTTGTQLYVAKYTDAGSAATPRWAVGTPTATGTSVGFRLAVSGTNIFVTGQFTSSATIAGTALSVASSSDIFLARFTDNATSVANVGAISGGGAGASDLGADLNLSGNTLYVTGTSRANATYGAYTLSSTGISSVPLIALASVANVTSPPTVTNFTALDNTICAGSLTTFTATVGNVTGSYGYTLTNGSSLTTGSTSSTALSQNLTATGSGVQTFTLTINNASQSVSSTTSVTVSTPSSATIAYADSPFCANDAPSSVSRTGTTGGTYSATPTGLSINSSSGQITPTSSASGVYTITYTMLATAACAQATATTSITINSSPTAGLTNNGPLSCTLTTVTLTASGGTSYTFVNSSGTVLTGTGNTRLVSTPGTYSVTVANASGCVSTTSTTVSSNTVSPLVSIAVNPSLTITQGSTTTLTASGATSYSWSSGASTAAISVSLAGTYSVTGISSGCSSSTGVVISVRPCGAVVYVTSTGAGLQDGSSWSNAFAGSSLQTAINIAANCGAQVWVAQGLYKPTTTTDRTISFSMKTGVSIYGGFTGGETTLSGRVLTYPSSTTLSGDLGTPGDNTDNSYNVIYNLPGLTSSAVLDGFLITGGNANLTNTFPYFYGGGILNNKCSPTIRNCTFQANSGFRGGAVCNYALGGGLASPQFMNCSFVANSSSNGGGAVWNAGNSSGNVSPQLVNCSFVNNSAGGLGGGAIVNDGCCSGRVSLQLTNCSFLANSTTSNGGAIWSQGASSGNASTQLTNCIFFNNGGENTLYNDVATVTANYSLFDNTVTGYTGNNNQTVNTSPFTSTVSTQLNACSPAINAGTNSASGLSGITTDLVGNARFYNSGIVDMGAYEFQGVASPQVGITAQPAASSLVCVGGTVTASVSVSGAASGYQWYKDGAVVSGQTSATLALTNVQTSDAGSYSVAATGSCNSVTSTAFSLTVNSLPTATLLPSSATLTCASLSVTLTAGSGTSYTLTGGAGPQINTTGQFVVSQPATYTLTVANQSGCLSTTTAQVISNTATPTVNIQPASTTLTCASPSVSLTVVGMGSVHWDDNSTNPIRSVNMAGTYSVTLTTGNGCLATTSTTVYGNTAPPSLSINPTSVTLTNASPTASLTALGTGSFNWSTGEVTSVISVTASGLYSVTLTNASGCSATASVPVTGSDLTLTLDLPQANFAASGTASVGNFVVNVFEVGGLPTSSGTVRITITAPVGYTLSFPPSLTTIQVAGGSPTPINNAQWTVSTNLVNRQLTLTMASGAFIGAGGKSSLGFSITRTSANSGSTANITVNVADDQSMTYDGNLANNVYARIISGL